MKRLLDVLISGVCLALSLPFWIAISVSILLSDGRPVLYLQRRVGRGGRVFTAYKFRSMINNAETGTGAVLARKEDPRITPVGRILRKGALDEIPQLLNIFKGDMSWVGPRPERPEFVKQFLGQIPGYAMRHQVSPGLTGVAQVYGRYYTDPVDKLRYDLYYVRNHSLWLDFRLFVMSWRITIKGRWDSTAARR